MRVTRAQVLAYRVAAQGLHRGGSALLDLAVLDIGVQDSTPDAARLAFDARLPAAPPPDCVGPGQPLALVWSLRGAPYVHRRRELDALAAALYPVTEADATARLGETRASIAARGIDALAGYELAASAMHAVVDAPTAKGAASTAVTRRLPAELGRDCRGCRARHISDPAMRLAALPAGLELEPGTSPPVLLPRPGARRPRGVDRRALGGLMASYLRVLGPATVAEAAGYLEARRADVAGAWPDDLVEVSVDGRPAWIPPDCLALLKAPPEPDAVRLLTPFDPWVQARDRDLIVPDRAAQKVLWPILGRPGVLLVDGEVAGTWRPKSSARRLTLTVETFAPLPASVWARVEDEAARMAAVRGVPDVRVAR